MFSTGTLLFLVSAVALLGSPGPGIASLLAIGRVEGWLGLRFYAGLQVGLAIAFGATAIGLLSFLEAIPFALKAMTIASIAYLVYLAYQIATAPIGSTVQNVRARSSATSGLLLGIGNPKAYIAFASLLASRTLVKHDLPIDALVKWGICVIVAIVVDIVWLFVGVRLKRATLQPQTERALNVILGVTILLSALLTLF